MKNVHWIIVVLALILTGCNSGTREANNQAYDYNQYSSGESSEDEVEVLQEEIESLKEEIEGLKEEADEVRIAADYLRGQIDSLTSEVDNFSDGYTNWRDVVREVESQASSVDSAMYDLERKIRSWSF